MDWGVLLDEVVRALPQVQPGATVCRKYSLGNEGNSAIAARFPVEAWAILKLTYQNSGQI